ncbi:hypothetical protein B0J11DRAFT_543906 [Dendryphion nanum]|uniref:DUF7924 domain-containing protein n=1 Tax=Dendryphion nanum TaxID=256645 RepID=A0A9P9D0I8_9PLEO|nr:hypothetical protein B0J11DRAFT_543906 [Dendryphion nanum]
MLGKRTRSNSSSSRPVKAQEATRPAKRQVRAIEIAIPHAKRYKSSLKHCAWCPCSIESGCSSALFHLRNRRACSVDPPTPPRLHNSSLHSTERRRARSLSRSPPPLPLTRENLHSFEHSIASSSPMSIPRNPSPTRKDTAITDKKQLAGYNITVDKGIVFPESLADLVDILKRGREQEPSPHAQAIVDTRRAASVENEINARKMMEEHILFRGEGYPGGIKYLTLKDQVNLVKDFLPQPPRKTTPELWGSLARPQPDSCIGYITATEATTHTPTFAMPFTREEDDMAEWYNAVHNADTHFPFLTAQWKAAILGENQVQASLQAARDGALIVNYMYDFYSLAYPNRTPTQLETCHFSVTTEGYTIILWIHWREVNPEDGEIYFRMEEVEMARMGKLDDLLDMRRTLHNYVDFALGERLWSIKQALPAFWPNRPKKKVRRTNSQSSTTVSGSELRFDMPMTPSSNVGDGTNEHSVPAKKMKRKLIDVSQ